MRVASAAAAASGVRHVTGGARRQSAAMYCAEAGTAAEAVEWFQRGIQAMPDKCVPPASAVHAAQCLTHARAVSTAASCWA